MANLAHATNEFDVIVVGAGVVGLACAHQLAQRGKRVCVIEQPHLLASLLQSAGAVNLNGASHGESRIIRLVHSRDIYLELAIDAYRKWRALEHEVGAKLYENNGLLWLGDEAGTRGRAAILSRFNAPYEVLDAAAIHRRYPHLNYDDKWFALLDHTAGTIFARKCLEALRHACEMRGVTFAYGERVREWRAHEATVAVTTSAATRRAASLVLAVGSWLNALVPRLKLRVEAVAVPVYYWTIAKEARGLYDPQNRGPNLIITDVPRDEELYAIANYDFDGKIKFAVHTGEPFDVAAADARRPTALVAHNRELTARHIRAHIAGLVHERPAVEVGCLYGVSARQRLAPIDVRAHVTFLRTMRQHLQNTEDRTFIVDSHPSHRNVILAAGFSGTGFKFAPAIGDVVADLACGRRPRFDIRSFAADRDINVSLAKL